MPQPSSQNITFFAPAKINLYLHIIAKRNDGYHLIESLVVFADCGDQVSVAPSNKLKLTIKGPFSKNLASNHDNLVIKAAILLANFAGIKAEADIVLTKELPVGSGLGGGSADAAATLILLSNLYNDNKNITQKITLASLFKIALSLGSDVPACLKSRDLFLKGYGEKLTNSNIPKQLLIILYFFLLF